MKGLTAASDAIGLKGSSGGGKKGLPQFASTRVRAQFFSDEGFDGVVDSNPDPGKKQPFKIVGFNYNKKFGSSPGSFSISVKSHNNSDLLQLWEDPEDVWVQLTAIKNGEAQDIMLGLIDTITENVDRGMDGTRTVTYQINGTDFQKVFQKTETFVNIHEYEGVLPAIRLYDAMQQGILGTPRQIVKNILITWLGNEGVGDKQWRLPASLGGRYFYDALELDFGETRGKLYDPTLLESITYMGQNLWGMLEEYSNGMLNELYTELDWEKTTIGGTTIIPRLVLRERPFPTKDDSRAWESLPTHYLASAQVHRRQITKGAPESRFNYWLIDGKGVLGNGLAVLKMIQAAAQKGKGAPGSAPVYSVEQIRKHGLRRWQQATRYLPFRADMDLLVISVHWLKMIHDWYSISPYALAGTITSTELLPQMRIGHRLLEGRRDGHEVTYYIEGVSQSWNYPGPGSTTLNVTRGEYAGKDSNLLNIVYNGLRGELAALDSALEAATGLLQSAETMSNAVPTGSGVQLDRIVGQTNTPEREYLIRRNKLTSDIAIKRGEPTYEDDNIANIRVDDLPDQKIPKYAQDPPTTAKPRKKVGSLTQEELEAGVRLPVRNKEHEEERSLMSEEEMSYEQTKQSRTDTSRKR